jgi:hypothetical protein
VAYQDLDATGPAQGAQPLRGVKHAWARHWHVVCVHGATHGLADDEATMVGSTPGACTAQGATAWHDLMYRLTRRKANDESGWLTSGGWHSGTQLVVRVSTVTSGEPTQSRGYRECTAHEEKG